MSDLDDTNENLTGMYATEEDNQPSAQETLDDRGVDDSLDEGYSPPEKPRGVEAFGTTAEEEARGETLDQRIAQEEPDPNLEVEDPLAADADDDPDAPSEADEFLDDGEVGGIRSGRLVAPDEGAHEDTEKDLLGDDVGIDGGAASAEEAAMHVVDVEGGDRY
ncbi:DUF5709 domain-containing protein [Angustibacter aerolatus]|nr:DUF5709 domain-containing protein [Angustibacter aerolatus]